MELRWYRRRWVRNTIIVVAVLTLVFLVGGGWYFSGLIRSDALAVKTQAESAPERIHEVLAVEDGAVVFALGDDPPDDLTSGEMMGVVWEGGYGLLGGVVSRDSGRIARTFTPYEAVTARPLGAGTMVGLEGYAYPADPAMFDPALAEVSYTSPFGPFDALWAEGDSSTWMIFVHGRGAEPREAYRMLTPFLDAGVSSLLIHYRNDEGQPGDDQLADFGVTEWEDLDAAVRFAQQQGAADVILFGASMGGAIVVSFLENSQLADRVSGVVLDAPALELGAMVDSRAGDTNLPLLPIKVPMVLTATAKTFASWRFGVNWGAIDYVDRIEEAIGVPVLLFHGADDETVPVELSDDAAAALGDLVTYERFSGAGHVRSWNVDPERYEAALAAFLTRVVG